MEPITTATIGTAIARGLFEVGKRLVHEGVVEVPLEPAKQGLDRFVQQQYDERIGEDKALRNAIQTALAAAGASTDDEDDVRRWLKRVSLDKLAAKQNDALRRQVARSILSFTDPDAEPPEDMVIALGWPRSRQDELSALLATLRHELYTVDDWRPLIEYANEAAKLGVLNRMLSHLARLDNVFVETEAGEALRVVLAEQELSRAEAARIEERYRADLVRDLRLHDFRGIVQMRRDIRLPLADIYLELGLLTLSGADERRQAQERMLELDHAARVAEDERRLQDRVSDALARAQRLVILGEPGAGKTISLDFIALMLAHGYGAARLGLDTPYIPLTVRLADYAQGLEAEPALSLDNFLFHVIEQQHTSDTRLADFLRLALEDGDCMVLLDGLDEVGDDPTHGLSLRTRVVQRVQTFADRWCTGDRANRLVVTSRLEGYWDESLHGFEHVELSRLRPPDEVRDFLLRWYTAHEQAHDPALPLETAEQRAEAEVADLLPRLMDAPSVRRLATNPLLLTILALIHENVGRLPNRGIKLYEICAQTLIESWRRAQTGLPSELLADLGEETVIRVMAPLAYWLHEAYPGGTAPFEAWRQRLLEILIRHEGFEEDEAGDIAERFLHHARHWAGLLTERGLDQFGFFHLTFEEYLAARQLARQRVEERREMLKAHWEDARWREVILLAAGQLGIVEARRDDVSDFVVDLLEMEPTDPDDAGRQVVLAGRALADIGPRSVTRRTRQWVIDALRETMQDREMETKQLNAPPRIPVRTRYAAGEALDELGWLPPDLNAWVRCAGCAQDGSDLMVMKYPVTNAQFERFIEAGGYENPQFWGGGQSEVWHWVNPLSYGGEGAVNEPEYWQNPRHGRERRGYPVVGVSWYEAAAYAAWLTELLRRGRENDATLSEEDRAVVADLLQAGVVEVRLPTEMEWEQAAGGVADENRYPWDPPEEPATGEEQAILIRANTIESDIGGTSPVAMYPLGASRPFGLMDLAGNVWEWTASWYDDEQRNRVLRGGAWYRYQHDARCANRHNSPPFYSYLGRGFRLVSPVVLDPGF